jgi:hypothetical protein
MRIAITASGTRGDVQPTDTAMQQRAAALGELIRTEDGITNAVEHIRHMLH